MIKNHTHNNDSGSIHYIFKKILDLGIIKEAFTIIPLFFKSYAVVDRVYKTQIFIECSCLIAPLHGYMNWHSEEPQFSFQSLKRRSRIG